MIGSNRKFAFILLAMIVAPTTTFAQGALGAEGVFDGDAEEFGVGVHGIFHTGGVVDSSRLALGARYIFVPSEELGDVTLSSTFLSFNLDGQYLIVKGFPALFYGLIGANVTYIDASAEDASGSVSESAVGVGLNLGVGGEFRLADTVSLFGEGKLIVPLFDTEELIDFDERFVFGAGVRFYFGGGGGGDVLSDI